MILTSVYALIFVACIGGTQCQEMHVDTFQTMKECGAMLAEKARDVDNFDKRNLYSLVCKAFPTGVK